MLDTRSVCVLAGGVGAARLLRGARLAVDPAGLTAIVNVGDDTVFHGLSVSPDLDTILYTLADEINPETGWGRRDETALALSDLRRHAAAAGRDDVGWFFLGDRDIGTHLWRTHRLAEGAALADVTRELCESFGVDVSLLPATNDPLSTRVHSPDLGWLPFQDYFVRLHHSVAVDEVRYDFAEEATPAPGVIDSIDHADAVIIAPSNPILSTGPVLAIDEIRAAFEAQRDRAVAISPIVGGQALKGPAADLMTQLGFDASVVGIARAYRSLASVLVIDTVDAHLASEVQAAGMECVVTNTIMDTPEAAAALTSVCLEAVS